MNMGMVHSIIRKGLRGLGAFCSSATLHAAWREDCMIPLPESRLVCIPSLVLQKIKDAIPYHCFCALIIIVLLFQIDILNKYYKESFMHDH